MVPAGVNPTGPTPAGGNASLAENPLLRCAGCGAVLTATVSKVALPIHLADTHWETLHPPLLEAGSYAVDREPYGPPWQPWDEVGAQAAAERGRFAPFGARCPTDRRTRSSEAGVRASAADAVGRGPHVPSVERSVPVVPSGCGHPAGSAAVVWLPGASECEEDHGPAVHPLSLLVRLLCAGPDARHGHRPAEPGRLAFAARARLVRARRTRTTATPTKGRAF